MFDIQALCEALRAAARTEILPRFGRPETQEVRTKSEAIDLVTQADLGAEAFLAKEAERLLPGALFVGEETVATQPELLSALPEAELALVIDPVDGTSNFAQGLPLFGVIAAVVRRGETVAGVLYDPFADDCVLAEVGAGAFRLRADGSRERLRRADPLPLEQMTGMFSAAYLPVDERQRVYARLHQLRVVSSFRCAAHEYRLFASGHAQFLAYNRLMPWDHLAGVLICQEAGAYAARFDASPYLPGHTGGGLIVAPDEASWRQLRERVFQVTPRG